MFNQKKHFTLVMNKKLLLFSILLLSMKLLSAQDIKYFFKKLPASYTKELSAKTKDSLLEGKNFYPADNDSEQIAVYKLEMLDLKRNWLRIEMSFESGQRGFETLELRSFKTKAGSSIVVFSDYGGTPVDFSQNNLSVFSYSQSKKLTKISSLGLITKSRH